MKELGIYIHIPFCIHKCYYCDFISYAGQDKMHEKYIDALIKEINAYDLSKYNVTTIYIGGGTPSSIDSKYIAIILHKLEEKLKNNLTNFENIEITIEVNPGTITSEKLKDYKNAKINRLSIGVQSTNNKLLKQIGRIHNLQDFLDTYNMARNIGFKNINVDLMFGLPSQTIMDLKESLNTIINLKVEHVSVYSLILEENTKLAKMVESQELKLPSEELERNMYWYVKNTLELNGYKHYEISNFAKKGKESKHNTNCWKQKEYIGLGCAAHSYLNKIRYSNTEKLDMYIQNAKKLKNDIKNIQSGITENIKIYAIQEIQNEIDTKNEYMMLGLRMLEGVSVQKFKEIFKENPLFLFRKQLDLLVKEKLIEVDLDKIRLTNKGLDFANLVFEEFV